MSDSNGNPLDQRLLRTRTRRPTPVPRRSAQLPSQPAFVDAALSRAEVKAEELTFLRATDPTTLYRPTTSPPPLTRNSPQERLSVRSYTSESASQEKGFSASPHPERLSLYFENASTVQKPRRNPLQTSTFCQLLPTVIERLRAYLQPKHQTDAGDQFDPFDRPRARQSSNDDFSLQIASSILSFKHVTRVRSLRPTFSFRDPKRRRRTAKKRHSVRPFKVRILNALPIFAPPELPNLAPIGPHFCNRISELIDMHLSEDDQKSLSEFHGRLERKISKGGFTKRVPPMNTRKLQYSHFVSRKQRDIKQ